jgi:hypothetical protein
MKCNIIGEVTYDLQLSLCSVGGGFFFCARFYVAFTSDAANLLINNLA